MHANAVGRNIRGLGAFFASPVFAQTAVDVKACAEKKGDEAIAACTRAIVSRAWHIPALFDLRSLAAGVS